MAEKLKDEIIWHRIRSLQSDIRKWNDKLDSKLIEMNRSNPTVRNIFLHDIENLRYLIGELHLGIEVLENFAKLSDHLKDINFYRFILKRIHDKINSRRDFVVFVEKLIN